MPGRQITTEDQREAAILWLQNMRLPFTLDVTRGKRRSTEQNRLQRKWMIEIAEQLGDQTPEEVRAFCKLHIGVPLLRAENEGFADKYDSKVKPYSYEEKLQFMAEPFDFPVTRLMTTAQHARYLDAIYAFWTARGMVLTVPPDKRYAA